MDTTPTKDVLIKSIVDGEIYAVWSAYHPEAGLPSYAIYNKVTDVIENFQPNYANALNVRAEFEEWYRNSTKLKDQEEMLTELSSVDIPH